MNKQLEKANDLDGAARRRKLLQLLITNEREFKRRLFNDRVEKNYLRLYTQQTRRNLTLRPQTELTRARENVEKFMPRIVDKSTLESNFNRVIGHLRKSSLSNILPITNIEALETNRRKQMRA